MHSNIIDFNSFSIGKLCVWYLVHSYLYYRLDDSVITDEEFDTLCKELLKRISNGNDEIPNEFKELISKDALDAGTGHSVVYSELPDRIVRIAYMFNNRRDYTGKQLILEDWLK